MEAFKPLERVVIGGINSFKFALADGVDVWPTDNDLIITEAAIILKSGFSWQTGYADYNSLEYVESEQYTPNGPVFTSELRGFLPDDLHGNTKALHQSFNKKYIVIFKTHQGTARVFGSPHDPCLFTFNTTTAKLGGRKGTGFAFKKKTPSLALYG